MSGNKNLKNAKKEKNDEFYTQYEDIQNELNHYEKHFKNKAVIKNNKKKSVKNGSKRKK